MGVMQRPLLETQEAKACPEEADAEGRKAGLRAVGFLLGLAALIVAVVTVCSHLTRGSHRTVLLGDGRSAIVYTPGLPLSPGRLRPAIFVLHGSYEAPSDYYGLGFEALAESRNFLVVYPEMKDPKRYDWAYPDDLPFFDELAGVLHRDFAADPQQLVVCGHSAGGTMALYLQSFASKVFKQAAAVSAGVYDVQRLHWINGRAGSTMLVWNHNDPVMTAASELNPGFNGTLRFLLDGTTGGSGGSSSALLVREPIGLASSVAQQAHIDVYSKAGVPDVYLVGWTSEPGIHEWPTSPEVFSATRLIVDFFFPWDPPAARGRLRRAESLLAADLSAQG